MKKKINNLKTQVFISHENYNSLLKHIKFMNEECIDLNDFFEKCDFHFTNTNKIYFKTESLRKGVKTNASK